VKRQLTRLLLLSVFLLACDEMVCDPSDSDQDLQSFLQYYGGPAKEEGRHVIPTSDGGLLITASVIDIGEVWIIKTDRYGDSEWWKTYRHGGESSGVMSAEVDDGGYVVLSNTRDQVGENELNAYCSLFRIDENGELLWLELLGGDGWDNHVVANSMILDEGGNVLVLGTHIALPDEREGALLSGILMRFNSSGEYLGGPWFELNDDTIGESIFATSDGGYLMAFRCVSEDDSQDYTSLVKYSVEDHEEWQTDLSGLKLFTVGAWFHGLASEVLWESPIGQYNVIGKSSDGAEVKVNRLDANGSIILNSTLGNQVATMPLTVASTSDGGFFFSGHGGFEDVSGFWVAKCDADANLEWYSARDEYILPFSIFETELGYMTIVGGTSGPPHLSDDVALIVVDENGVFD
jgi:hypothetical protein